MEIQIRMTKFVSTTTTQINMKISIGNDHAGPDYKKAIVHYLISKGHEILNHGTDTFDSVDYPDFGHPVATDVESGKADLGIVICGSGNGIAMTANKHQGIRAALCWTKEISALARQHNDANVVSIPARFTSIQQAIEIVDTFLNTDFEGGRHATRVDKISCS
ncbi:ribose 5-phosphate isomerase B [Flavobacterium cheonanense]|uniref:Ribose 5-phosphate isomerase B n=2 Tax=Flavobacterium cheonanense TaxID=706183 RepID=A0ABP7VIT7_9FLAO